ncbi:MAG TPA: UDP-N-acetylmuramate dehydrogenase, partial [Thermoanaerobaculia bacterium]|nr:UDP-N-acetylmuramate dehydrogenase [Thermoanaerobaculia bacterium]
TIGIGGPARWLVEVDSVEALGEALSWARAGEIPLFLLGGGSNVLISDEGFDRLVIHNRITGVDSAHDGDAVRLRVGAGESWDALVERAVERRWGGIEALSGIPGSVGATPIQNVGAYGQEVAESIVSVEAIHVATGAARTFTPGECRFEYRDSIFKREARGEFIIVAVSFRLQPGQPPALRYPELQRSVEEHFGASPTLPQVREAVLAIRKRKGMVVDPEDPDSRSDGSFFTNPILSLDDYQAFLQRATEAEPGLSPDRIPSFPASEGRVKLSAAWLIEHAGFTKGYGAGRVGLSTKHTLAIVNRGEGTAVDVLSLVAEIQRAVANRFGVAVRPEPVFVGF